MAKSFESPLTLTPLDVLSLEKSLTELEKIIADLILKNAQLQYANHRLKKQIADIMSQKGHHDGY